MNAMSSQTSRNAELETCGEYKVIRSCSTASHDDRGEKNKTIRNAVALLVGAISLLVLHNGQGSLVYFLTRHFIIKYRSLSERQGTLSIGYGFTVPTRYILKAGCTIN